MMLKDDQVANLQGRIRATCVRQLDLSRIAAKRFDFESEWMARSEKEREDLIPEASFGRSRVRHALNQIGNGMYHLLDFRFILDRR